ncbi:hypothetical protein OSB04_031419 [Centaurea solstitialis]|uniref:TTF-type domain-containing protein n=1 Tax=Centaurea solstitialis TaxID=347529 RepID=A0AA38W837_9ASTR|nr:hypothetical protein OSB04_031419 [Centaurea solstitialis]
MGQLESTISRSSAEAEYRGVANVVTEICWLRNLLLELHRPLSQATSLSTISSHQSLPCSQDQSEAEGCSGHQGPRPLCMKMKTQSTINGKHASSSSQDLEETINLDNAPASNVPVTENPRRKVQMESNDIDLSTLERDPGLRLQVYDYPVNQQDTVRRAYLSLGPLQPTISMFPKSGPKSHKRSFQASWYRLYPWIEYSKTLDAAFCFPCLIFNKPCGLGYHGQQAFTKDGFRNWKKVGGKKCVLLMHMGTECTSFHNVAQKAWDDLLKEAQDIRNVFEKFTTEEREKNRLRLRASIYSVRWCAFQAVAFRGHNEKPNSINRGNFLEMLEALGEFSSELKDLFCRAPKYASYTSPMIQKEILNLISNRVRRMISEEIGNKRYCLLVDEARDESHKEQMSVVLRFVNKEGYIIERFFGLVHVRDTMAQTLKDGICSLVSHYNLDVKSIRGQGYDGASNMRGQFKGLQALILEDCKYAYYVHCLAHRLQLALMAASQVVIALRKFFTQLTFIVNVVSASSKRTDQLRDAQVEHIAYLIFVDELETGRGLNQIGTLQRAGDTRWSSHLRSVSSLIKMFSPTCEVLLKVVEDGNDSSKGDADSAYEAMTTFEFIFVLHLVKEIMGITDLLCQALQRRDQDIFNALRLIASTKMLLQKLKDEGWDDLLCRVKSFCQLMELDHRFSDSSMELLRLASTLDPKNECETFRSADVCQLVEKFYPEDFSDQEKTILNMQLQHYDIDVVQHEDYKKLTSIADLCQWLVKTKRKTTFDLIYRVISLLLTLPASTATTERSFSAMNTVKTRIRNKMEDEFLNDSLVLFIEREVAEKISLEEIMEDFKAAKDRRVPL